MLSWWEKKVAIKGILQQTGDRFWMDPVRETYRMSESWKVPPSPTHPENSIAAFSLCVIEMTKRRTRWREALETLHSSRGAICQWALGYWLSRHPAVNIINFRTLTHTPPPSASPYINLSPARNQAQRRRRRRLQRRFIAGTVFNYSHSKWPWQTSVDRSQTTFISLLWRHRSSSDHQQPPFDRTFVGAGCRPA